MEEPATILSKQSTGGTEFNIQRPMYSNAQAKLIESENKLNRVFEEYTGRIESFMLMMDVLNDGVWVIDNAGQTCYCNDAANAVIKKWEALLNGHTNYRQLTTEQVIEVGNGTEQKLQLRINNFLWEGEAANIFVLKEITPVIVEVEIAAQPTVTVLPATNPLIEQLKQIAQYEASGNLTQATAGAEQALATITASEKLSNDARAYMALVNYKPVLTQASMQKIAGDVLRAMGPEIEDAEIDISVSELPETVADKELITKLLKQLIANAIKFRNKGRKATIDIGHDKSDGQFIFCVRDNGIGISKKHHEEIFNLFTSLNDATEYPGNGMGLAICKKIVELHEGKIWVESLPGHGSNFYFRLAGK